MAGANRFLPSDSEAEESNPNLTRAENRETGPLLGGGMLDYPPDPELVATGWQRRFMVDPVRATEMTQLYQSLGFDVQVESIQVSELQESCGDCRLEICRAYMTIYTRKKE